MPPKSDVDYALEGVRAKEFAWTELTTILKGGDVSLDALFETFRGLDAAATYPALDVPVYMMMGRNDRVVSPIQAEAYFDVLDAPSKEFMWFENSAHSPQWEEADRFNAEMLRIADELNLTVQL